MSPAQRVLFVCAQNSARSHMAAALLNHLCTEAFAAESAGLEPGVLNPLAVAALAEVGLDIAVSLTKSAFELFRAGRTFDFVIAVCEREAAARCPVFPGTAHRLHWPFSRPGRLHGHGGATPGGHAAGARRPQGKARRLLRGALPGRGAGPKGTR